VDQPARAGRELQRRGATKKASRDLRSPEARCAFDAPSAWLSLAGLRPRRARLRFTRRRPV
jgi:hypothetical protein